VLEGRCEGKKKFLADPTQFKPIYKKGELVQGKTYRLLGCKGANIALQSLKDARRKK